MGALKKLHFKEGLLIAWSLHGVQLFSWAACCTDHYGSDVVVSSEVTHLFVFVGLILVDCILIPEYKYMIQNLGSISSPTSSGWKTERVVVLKWRAAPIHPSFLSYLLSSLAKQFSLRYFCELFIFTMVQSKLVTTNTIVMRSRSAPPVDINSSRTANSRNRELNFSFPPLHPEKSYLNRWT